MPALILTPAQRSELRSEAHALNPVVIIGAEGLTKAVLAEIDRSLAAHGLIKIRVFSDDREALYETWSEGRLLGEDSTLGRQLAALSKSMLFPETAEMAVKQTGKRAKNADANQTTPAGAPSPSGIGRFFSFMRSSRA